jgi:tRNA wybutosine-synthesizing protein 2
MHVTHIAINAPIPPVSSPAGNAGQTEENTLRAPLSLNPLYGDFGAFQPPCLTAFSTAFWVSTRQHGIYQTWAPLYTMFSRGNISEKARILQLPELRAEALGCDSDETCAVDLYAGIGYFSFCYAKAGVGKVLGWELNGWSIEGFRRGAEKNKWSVRVVSPEEEIKEIGEEKLTVFHDNNQNAVKVIEKIRGRIPPVRHVNCGFLPSSKASWSVAVKVLDPQLGGWVHVHENIAEEDIHRRKDEITALLRELVDRAAVGTESVRCQHLQRVKSYAPGIIHCVLDINIPPICD